MWVKQIKQGDDCGRNVTVEMFRQKVINVDMKIIAITNHNAFDIKQFNLFKDAVSEDCLLLPGVEIEKYLCDNIKHNVGEIELIIDIYVE